MSKDQQNRLSWAGDIMTWLPRLYGTDVGTGSGLKLAELQLRRTGQAFTGYELIEFLAKEVSPYQFSIVELLEAMTDEFEDGVAILLEPPAPNNEMGRYRFDQGHPFNVRMLQERE
jgi:hypothetical protein